MKRNLIVILFLLLLAAGGYFYFYFPNKELPFSKDNSLYKAIPVNSPFFFELSSAKSVPFDNPLIRELDNAGIGSEWFAFLHKTDSLIDHTNGLSRNLQNSPFILAFDYTGRSELVPLIIKSADSNKRKEAFEKLLHTLYPPGNYNYSKKEYDNHRVTEISGDHAGEFLCFSFVNGLLLVSTKTIPVEKVIRQMQSPGIRKDSYFLEANKTAASQGVSLYINHSWLPGFFENVLNGKATERVDEFGATVRTRTSGIAEKFSDFASWSELDFRFGDETLILSGISVADDSLNHFLSVFADQQPVRFDAENILPRNTSFFCSFSFSDKKSFFEKLEDFYTHSPGYYRREERIKRFDNGLRTNVRNVFQGIVKNEVIVAATTIPVNPENKTTFFIVQTEGRSAAEDEMKKLLANYARRAEIKATDLQSSFAVDDETRFTIYRFPYPSFPGIWLGTPFALAEARYISFYDNFMVFSNSEEGLHEYLRNMVLGNTLTKEIRYQQFRQSSSSRANINVFADVNKAYSFRNELFSPSVLKHMEKNEESLRKFDMVNWQVQRDKDIYFNSVAVAYRSDVSEEAQTTWQSSVGSNVQFKPQLVVNHHDVANREIIFQDEQNNLHQVTHSGRVRWSIALPGPVLGEIHQVDYFKNGNLQYLFNTKEKLYLIDRNGNNVAHFPVPLRSPATNGVNVFDYDNNRNYRYFVAGEDRKVYAYDYEGKVVKGWVFNQTDHEVTKPVQHFRVAGKDYIVFKDKARIYVLDRRGESRVSVSARFENSDNPIVLNLDGRPKMVTTDTGGKVYYIYFDGKFEEKKTGRFSENHFFTVDDLDGNKIPDFVFIDKNEVTVMNENGKKLFSKKLDNPLRFPPNIYTFAADLKKVGVTDALANRIYLFNPDGKLHDGFPLAGNSEFSIGRLSESSSGLNLIVGSEGGKLFNYTLN